MRREGSLNWRGGHGSPAPSGLIFFPIAFPASVALWGYGTGFCKFTGLLSLIHSDLERLSRGGKCLQTDAYLLVLQRSGSVGRRPWTAGRRWGGEGEQPRPNILMFPTSSSKCQPRHVREGSLRAVSRAAPFLLHRWGRQIPGATEDPAPSTPTRETCSVGPVTSSANPATKQNLL